MEWIPWNKSRYDEVCIPAHGALPVNYTCLTNNVLPVRCGQPRCEQNYFDAAFLVEGQTAYGFHMGLN